MIVNIRETRSCEIYSFYLFPLLNEEILLFNHLALSIYDILLTDIYIIYIYIG